jgi:hypothetical protein
VTIGTDAQNRYLPGVIDEVRIYDRALSAAEVADLTAAPNESANAWHRRFFGETPINWSADDDDDQGERLLEYAMGAEPRIADAVRMKIQAEVAGSHLRVRFPRRLAGTHELAYLVQASPDLIDWDTLGASEIGTEPDPVPGFERAVYQATAGLFEVSPLFIRLQIGWQ